MKKVLLIALLQFAFTYSHAQDITYTQAVKLYNSWMASKGKDYKPVSLQLKLISPKWTIMSNNPIIEEDEKYYIWECPQPNKDSQQFAAYLEEDDETVKYSLRYVFFSRTQYDAFEKAIRAADPVAKSTTYTNKKETEIFSQGTSKSILLKEFPIEDSGNGKFGYTFDIFSKYIKK